MDLVTGKGQNYEFHNVENQKEHRKIWRQSQHRKALLKGSERRKRKRSEHRKCLLSSSLLRQKSDFQCSDFTYGVKKDHNVENQNINYLWRITYGYQGLWGVRLGSIGLG
jgi:hypothetical protein